MDYYEKAISFEALYKAMIKSCRNVRWKDSVVGYEANGLRNTLRLMEDLENETYELSKYQKFIIYEPKKREIIATRLRDRQFQRALCDNGLYEDITEHFIADNAACQVGRGTDYTLNRMKKHLRKFHSIHENKGWVLKCDIHHFFQETRHDVAKAAVTKYIRDEKAAEAVCVIIDSFGEEKGIGLGSQVSQLVELLVLNDLDHYIKERLRIKYYVRYMDDFVLIHEDKEHLKYCRKMIEEKLRDIGLELNKKTSLYPIKQGIVFLKWRFVLTDTGKVIMLMDRKKISKQRRRLRKLIEKESKGLLPPGTAQTSLECWLANAYRGNTRRICCEMKNYFQDLKGEYFDA